MKKPKLIWLIAIIVIVSTLSSGLFVNFAKASTIQFSEAARITSNSADQENPDIYADGPNNYNIVWMDNRNGNWDIYMYHEEYLGNGSWDVRPEIRITTNQGNNENPKIYNNTIVYQSDRNGNWDIYMYNITSKIETQITNNSASQQNPAIDGNLIVWQGYQRGHWDIYLYDLTTQSERQVTSSFENNYSPAISGNRTVYVRDLMGGTWQTNPYTQLCWFDLSTGQTQIIDQLEGKGNMADPAIDGNNITWARRYSTWDIFEYNILNDIDTQKWHAPFSAQQQHPDISGNYVVDTDDKNGNLEIYMSDYVVGQEYRVTNNNATQLNPRIFAAEYDNFIVYMDNRNGNWDIYLTMFWYGVGATGPSNQSTPSPSLENPLNSDNQGLIIIVSAITAVVVALVGAAAFVAKQRKSRKPNN